MGHRRDSDHTISQGRRRPPPHSLLEEPDPDDEPGIVNLRAQRAIPGHRHGGNPHCTLVATAHRPNPLFLTDVLPSYTLDSRYTQVMQSINMNTTCECVVSGLTVTA